MAVPDGRGGWDLTDDDVAEVMAASFRDDEPALVVPAWCTPEFMDKLVGALVPWVKDNVVDYPTGFINEWKIARYAAEAVVPVVLAAIAEERG